jgi:hypothetical protein
MTIANYCYKKGMTLNEFKTFQSNIKESGKAILQLIKQNYKTGNGLYHSINELFSPVSDETVVLFQIQELKNLGVEFYNNNTEWRF